MKYVAFDNSNDISLPDVISQMLDRGNVYVTLFIYGDSKSLSIYPLSDTVTVWKPGAHKTVVCSACGRPSDQAYPYCHWCGEQVSIDPYAAGKSLKIQEKSEHKGSSHSAFQDFIEKYEEVDENA